MLNKERYFIGLMSGTSLDGVDAVLVSELNGKHTQIEVHFAAYSSAMKAQLLRLHQASDNELHLANMMANHLAEFYAQATLALLAKAKMPAEHICAIGCHGQTIRHCPNEQGLGYSVQLGNHALLAERTNITVVGDFRNRDIAAGGQGAPLVPAFHLAAFASEYANRVILNIGGIANVSYLPVLKSSADSKQTTMLGFDTGPGNMLIDHWVQQHLGLDYDAGGQWCAGGNVLTSILNAMLTEPYFASAPPKSTGRDLFNHTWLAAYLSTPEAPQDVARTLLELSALSIANAIAQYCPHTDEVYVCGGGAHNTLLIKRIAQLTALPVHDTQVLGVGVDWVEAVAFAWLAQRCIDHQTASIATVTGASGTRVLGAIYPR